MVMSGVAAAALAGGLVTSLAFPAAAVGAAGAGRHGPRVLLGLSDGSEEALDPATLTVDGAGILRAFARAGRLEALGGVRAVE